MTARTSRVSGTLQQALETYPAAQWRHMQAEETLLLPAAQELLSDDEWSQIAAAFGENGDPRFDRHIDGDFRELFAQIMNQAAPARVVYPG